MASKKDRTREVKLFCGGALFGLFFGLWLCWPDIPAPCKGHEDPRSPSAVRDNVQEMKDDTDAMLDEIERTLNGK